jgi:hypothetical protein
MTAEINTAELRALAEGATAGPWHFSRESWNVSTSDCALDIAVYMPTLDDGETDDPSNLTGEYIAAANPSTMLALLDRLEKAEQQIAASQQGSEPVAWMLPTGHGTGWRDKKPIGEFAHKWTPLFTHPIAPAGAGEAGKAVLSPLDYRAQGRMEAMQVILSEEAESPFDSCVTSSANGDAGDYSTYWNEAKLRELLHIDDTAYNAFDKAECSYWDSTAKIEQAERAMRVIERAPYFKPLHDFLAKHQEWNLLHDLQSAATEVDKAVLSRSLLAQSQGFPLAMCLPRSCLRMKWSPSAQT